jgi:tetratricopeptide (TPR) repeat protein
MGGGPTIETLVTLQVAVREPGGAPLQANAIVKLSNDFHRLRLTGSTMDASTASFPNLKAGEYDLEVEAPGYKTTTDHASIFGGSTMTVYVYMHPESEPAGAVASGKTIMTPRLQAEIDKATDKMRRKQFDAAGEHFQKAAKIAPGNPDIQYLWGMCEYSQNHFDLARAKFDNALQLSPTHDRALVAMGELDLRVGKPEEASQALEKAFLVNGADWRTHFLLAFAYAKQREFIKAQQHAERAAELGKQNGGPARLLLGRIYVAEGKNSDAKSAFERVVRDFPNETCAADAKAALLRLEQPAPAAFLEASSAARPVDTINPAIAEPATPPVNLRPWAPPDVDAKEYEVAPGISCSMDQVLQRTQTRVMKQISNFEKFVATEHIEHQDIDSNGNSSPARTKDFNYLVFIHQTKRGSLYLEEDRDGGENLSEFPTSLATRGLVGLGVFLFDPEYQNDIAYQCDGLSEWRGQAAWEIRFEERRNTESRLVSWRNQKGVFPVAIKGRVWVASNTYDVLHLETDLREPIVPLELERDHLSIDYGPVKFNNGNTSLWLPWYAEMYMQFRGKRYHHRHTLTNYALFSVDTDNKVSAPKEQQTESQ